MFEKENIVFYIIGFVVTLSFVYAAIWLFFKVRYGNRHKKWFRLIFNGKEWTPVIKSMEVLNQADECEIENKNTSL